MKTNTQLFLLGIITFVLVVINWSKIQKFLSPSTYANTPYQQCMAKNKALPEGTECTNCIPEGADMANFFGTIQGGICTPPRQPDGV